MFSVKSVLRVGHVLFMGALFAVPANAVGDFSRATVTLNGTIRSKCSISLGSVDINAVANTGNSSFNIDCNTPMQYAIKATYGRLRHVGHLSDGLSDVDGFAVELPYSIDIQANNNPYGQPVSGVNVPQDALRNGAVVTANTGNVAPYVTTGTLSVTRHPLPAGQMAQAGNYQDRVTVEVTPYGS